jgi:hypothetical protein
MLSLQSGVVGKVTEGDADKAGVTMRESLASPTGGYTFWVSGCESPWLTKSLPSAT